MLGVSPDQPDKLVQFRTKENLDITLLSDPDHPVHEPYGAWGEKTLYGKKMVGVIRSTFVIDENGTSIEAWRNVKATGHVDRVLKELGPRRLSSGRPIARLGCSRRRRPARASATGP